LEPSEIVLTHQNQIKKAHSISEINPVNYSLAAPTYVILTSQKLLSSDDESTAVYEYAKYRSSAEGGNHQVTIVTAEELYNQFAYGVDRHFISVRNFTQYIKNIWTDVEFLFIIGRGRAYADTRFGEETESTFDAPLLVPTFGVPGGDHVLFSELGSNIPEWPVGRLAARSDQEIINYLDKVRLHEHPEATDQTIQDQLWKKRVLHLSGGSFDIQELLFTFLGFMKESITSNLFGAQVETFRKRSAEPIQIATSGEILDLINDGTSIITFFGHSAVGTFDFSLEQPSVYNNYGKYPLIISLGCHSGNIHGEASGVSESFVFEKDKGAIAFLASSSGALVDPQFFSGSLFYQLVGDSLYGKSIGEVIKFSIEAQEIIDRFDVYTLNEQLTLHGDPAIKLHPNEGPDLTIDSESAQTIPALIDPTLDSFNFVFDLVNLGQFTSDSLNLMIQHQGPNDEIIWSQNQRVAVPSFAKKLSITVPIPDFDIQGKNTMFVEIDPNNILPEFPNTAAESNNKLLNSRGDEGFDFFILDHGVRPVFPLDFSIVSDSEVIIKASTSNAFTEPRRYTFELSTNSNFDEPILERENFEHIGGLIEWNPNTIFQDGTVYYWRVKPDNTASVFDWQGGSFTFRLNQEAGWSQNDYGQWIQNSFDGYTLNQNQEMQFDTNGVFISIFNRIYESNPDQTGYQVNFENFAASVRPWAFMDAGVALVVGDGTTGRAWVNSGGDFGSIATDEQDISDLVFGFATNTMEERATLIHFLENEIPSDSYVFLFTVLANENSSFSALNWNSNNGEASIFSTLENQGANLIRNMESMGDLPYTIVYQKDKKVFVEDIANTKYGFIKSDIFLPLLFDRGSIRSTMIGEASKWNKITWGVESGQQAIYHLNVFGINQDGEKDTLLVNQTISPIDISQFSAQQYSQIILEFYGENSDTRIAPQLKFWEVQYTPLPDLVLAPIYNYRFDHDTLEFGEDMFLEVDLLNLHTAFNSDIEVLFRLQDESRNEIKESIRIDGMAKDEVQTIEWLRSTADLNGAYQFTVEINPENNPKEHLSFNNFGTRSFSVVEDKRPPILDVTFDDKYILDFDIIRTQPVIKIVLNDNNPRLPIDDFDLIDIKITFPDGSIWQVNINDANVLFITESESMDNSATVILTPALQDGNYNIEIVGRDLSQNIVDYQRNFSVIGTSGIQDVIIYPNPVHETVSFGLTLTGTIPDEFELLIFNTLGQVIKQIPKEQMNLSIGKNNPLYTWDLKENAGAVVQPGVYYYLFHVSDMNVEANDLFKAASNASTSKTNGKILVLK